MPGKAGGNALNVKIRAIWAGIRYDAAHWRSKDRAVEGYELAWDPTIPSGQTVYDPLAKRPHEVNKSSAQRGMSAR